MKLSHGIQAFALALLTSSALAAQDGIELRWRGVHTRADAEAGEVVAIKLFSSAYFDVMDALAEVAPVLREFDHVIIAGVEVSLEVSEDGADDISQTELRRLVTRFRGDG